MSNSYRVGDDASIVYPITDREGGNVDWANPQVLADDTPIAATWLGAPAPTRDVEVPLQSLPVGVYTMWLLVPDATDIKLGTVHIVEASTTAAADYTVCQWPVDAACFDTEWEAMDPAVQTRALAFASSTLYRLTGYRVGGCPITVRPCKAGCLGAAPQWFPGVWMFPHIAANGVWVNACGCEPTDCSCTQLCEVELPGPVTEVQEVTLDGGVVPRESYRVDGQRLVWTGLSDCPWPTCQDLSVAPDAVGSFTVTYLNSYRVDGMGAYAAAVLAMEFAQACIGNNCRLPASVTSITRQGVAFDIPTGAFPGGFTGIREVDAYLSIWNPQALREQPRVWSPDLRSPRVVR